MSFGRITPANKSSICLYRSWVSHLCERRVFGLHRGETTGTGSGSSSGSDSESRSDLDIIELLYKEELLVILSSIL